MSERRTMRVRVRGKVQGVGYRDWTERRARALGLDGWVRNMPDGSVEALVAGTPDAIDRMLAEFNKGPPSAGITGVEPLDGDAEGDGVVAGQGFAVRY